MNYKVATYISLSVLMIINVIYFLRTLSLNIFEDGFGPGFYPLILSVLLFIFLMISFIKTYLKDNSNLTKFNLIKSIKKITPIVFIIVLFFILWTYIGYFYILSLFLLISLLFITKPSVIYNKKELFVNLTVFAVYVVVIYVVFDKLLSFNL